MLPFHENHRGKKSMTQSFSLSSAVSVFPCPNCKETINTSMQQCSFCSVPIDHAAAEQSAAETSRISSACSDASYLKIMAWSLLTFFVLFIFPFLGLVGLAGFWFLRIAIPVMCIRWWIKYGSIKTDDPDFPRARLAAMIVSGVGVLALLDALPIHISAFGH
jgi:hypothetical protein